VVEGELKATSTQKVSQLLVLGRGTLEPRNRQAIRFIQIRLKISARLGSLLLRGNKTAKPSQDKTCRCCKKAQETDIHVMIQLPHTQTIKRHSYLAQMKTTGQQNKTKHRTQQTTQTKDCTG
jgi:hypothetical protein